MPSLGWNCLVVDVEVSLRLTHDNFVVGDPPSLELLKRQGSPVNSSGAASSGEYDDLVTTVLQYIHVPNGVWKWLRPGVIAPCIAAQGAVEIKTVCRHELPVT